MLRSSEIGSSRLRGLQPQQRWQAAAGALDAAVRGRRGAGWMREALATHLRRPHVVRAGRPLWGIGVEIRQWKEISLARTGRH